MNRKHFIITISVIAAFAFLLLNTFSIIGVGIEKDFLTIEKGLYSGIGTVKYCVIQNDNDWMQIWTNHTKLRSSPSPLPDVNFSKMTVIAVFMGVGGRYEQIEIKKILDTGLSIVVEIEGFYSGARRVTNPFQIIQVDKLSKWVIFKL